MNVAGNTILNCKETCIKSADYGLMVYEPACSGSCLLILRNKFFPSSSRAENESISIVRKKKNLMATSRI